LLTLVFYTYNDKESAEWRRIVMNITLKNEKEAKEYIDEIKDYLIAELIFNQLMKQPEKIRIHLFKMLMQEHKEDD
jgi:hypothetical protein